MRELQIDVEQVRPHPAALAGKHLLDDAEGVARLVEQRRLHRQELQMLGQEIDAQLARRLMAAAPKSLVDASDIDLAVERPGAAGQVGEPIVNQVSSTITSLECT